MRVPKAPPPIRQLLQLLSTDDAAAIVGVGIEPTHNGVYRHWDELLRRTPPAGLTHEQWWLATKLARGVQRPLPLTDVHDQPFTYTIPDPMLELLHQIDQRASGRVSMPAQITSADTRDRYILSSLIEEAIASSQLEGASTTRRVAKEMIRTGRSPRTRAERMILNNYFAINKAREARNVKLTPDLVLELHEIVTENTLDDPDDAGRIQTNDEDRVSVYYGDVLVHTPPPAAELPDRLARLCDFANDHEAQPFVHPVVRAIALHFWLAYDHPFADGNGRTARILFYWAMLAADYWLAEFLSISRILVKAPAQYGKAFLYTESDENDMTYFILYQLHAIDRATTELYEYLERKAAETREAEDLLRNAGIFNHRQLALLSHALRHTSPTYTYLSHAQSHGVVRQTARTDILELRDRGLLESARVGRTIHFFPASDLQDRLANIGDG